MSSEDSMKKTEIQENPNDAANIEAEHNLDQVPVATVVRLEGTHTTATDTDTLATTNEVPIAPETSKNVRRELQNLSATPEESIELKSKYEEECHQKSVGDMIHEMNENIQAIISMFSQRKIEMEVEKFKNELIDFSNVRREIENVKCPAQQFVLDIEPTTTTATQHSNEVALNSTQNSHTDMLVPFNMDQMSISSHYNNDVAPCESAYHTLHIHASNSPTASVMYRPPICLRLWMVITDLFTAICVCLQVNRDCIFCLGFFIAFVVSASFLTAFFYRTLSLDPQMYRNQKIQHQMEREYPKQILTSSLINY